MHYWKSSLLLLAGVLLSACSSGGGDDTDETITASSDPINFYTHTAVFLNNTTVYTWGSNESGQLGNGTTERSNIPVLVARFGNYSAGNGVATGSNHTLAFQKYSTIRAWGFNRYGQLGNGVTPDNQTPNSKVPVTVKKKGGIESLSGVVAVAAGGYHSLALARDISDSQYYVWSWGDNSNGQLGRQPQIINSVFVPIETYTADKVQLPEIGAPLNGITAIAAGGRHSMALDNSGVVWAWGHNGYGQLGNSHTLNSNGVYPTPVTIGKSVVKIAAGGGHSLALDVDGNVWGWGFNYFGQVGDGTRTNRSTPVQVMLDSVTPLTGITMIAAGLDHSLAYDATHDILYAWGLNLYGQLGEDQSLSMKTPNADTPYEPYAKAIQNFTLGLLSGAISTAGHHSHARKADGSWWSWGDNISGQLGIGSWTNSSTPVRVSGM